MILSAVVLACLWGLLGSSGEAATIPEESANTTATQLSSNGTDSSADVVPGGSADLTTPRSNGSADVEQAPDMARVCDQLAASFNSINQILPMVVYFDGGEAFGMHFPPGKIVLDSKARKLDACRSYQLRSGFIIVHIELLENMEIQFSNYTIEGKNWTLAFGMEGSHIVLQYNMVPALKADGTKALNMSVLMGEVKSLGKVTVRSDFGAWDGQDFTDDAEDLMRPRLFRAFNRFAKEHLHWLIDPTGRDSSLDGFDAFKLLFKRQMIEISNRFT